LPAIVADNLAGFKAKFCCNNIGNCYDLKNHKGGAYGQGTTYVDVINQAKRGVSMAQNEEVTIDQLAQQLEITLDIDYERKDLKAQRSMTKLNLYDGSKKLKHIIPKGKRV